MAVTIEIGSNGSTVMVEPELRKGLTRRVFRYMADGSLEWAAYDDWRMNNERARFFSFLFGCKSNISNHAFRH